MEAAIYCRVSTDNQEREGTSLQTQLEACLKYSCCREGNKGFSRAMGARQPYAGERERHHC